jgi:lipopolysaccharide transport system permease protein
MADVYVQRPSTEVVIRPSAGWRAVDLRQVWRARELLYTLALRDVKVRYRQTILGVAWVVLIPLLGAGIFSFIFGEVADLPTPSGVPYFVFSYAGLMGWNIFNSTLTGVSMSLVRDAGLVAKVYFPRLVLPLAGQLSVFINFCVAMAMMCLLWIRFDGTFPGLPLLALPAWFVLMAMLAMGIGLVAAALQVSYRDVGHLLPVVTQLLLYASPVAYAVDAIPENVRWVYSLNPLVGALEAFRWSLVAGSDLDLSRVAYTLACALVLMTSGALAFARMERKFADVV